AHGRLSLNSIRDRHRRRWRCHCNGSALDEVAVFLHFSSFLLVSRDTRAANVHLGVDIARGRRSGGRTQRAQARRSGLPDPGRSDLTSRRSVGEVVGVAHELGRQLNRGARWRCSTDARLPPPHPL
ncbi:unnamed protein product, partial [Ectocarpus sp. 12 AP-2014]